MKTLALVVAWIGLLLVVAQAQDRMPSISEFDRVFAQLAISRDGKTMTVRGVAPDTLTICVEPRTGHFGPLRCTTAGDVRRGEVRWDR